ncbi:hypothetical protein ACWEF9_21375 [Streptomyces sp. NPDC004980]
MHTGGEVPLSGGRITHKSDLLTLLGRLDDPEWLEQPRNYRRSTLSEHFERLVARLENDFTTRCHAEQDTQDSSEYGRIVVPAEATGRGSSWV